MEEVKLLISTLCIFHFNLVLIASMSMELKIAHGMQLLVWPGGIIYLFIFSIVCVLAGVQQRTGATHSNGFPARPVACSQVRFVRLLQGARVFLLF